MRVQNITVTVSVRVSAMVRVSLVLLFCITMSVRVSVTVRVSLVLFVLLAVTLLVHRVSPSADVVYIRY